MEEFFDVYSPLHIMFEYNIGMELLDHLKKYNNKTIRLSRLKEIFKDHNHDYNDFKYHLLEENDKTGIYDVIDLDECYIGFSYQLKNKKRIKITGFYRDK